MTALLRVGRRALPSLRRSIACVPLFGGTYLTTFALSVLISFVLAQSWNWIGGEMGYINLGHFAFYGIGAYAFCLPLIGGVAVELCFLAVDRGAGAIRRRAGVSAVSPARATTSPLRRLPWCRCASCSPTICRGSPRARTASRWRRIYVLGPAYAMAAALALATFATTLC